VGVFLCFCALSPAAAAAESGEAAEPPVRILEEARPRPELQVVSGVKGWIVNGREISLNEVGHRATIFHGPYVLQDMVAQVLLEQEAERRGIAISQEEAEAKLKALREELGIRSEAALESFLRTQRVTMDWLRAKAGDYALLEKVFADQTYVSDREIETAFRRNPSYYDQPATVWYRLLSFPTKQDADAALAELRKGRPFPDTGGLRVYERGRSPALLPAFEQALFAAPLNQVRGPIKLLDTYHLIRVEKKTDPHRPTLDQVRDVIRGQLRRQKLEQVVWPQWIKAQIENADIRVVTAAARDADAGGGSQEEAAAD
jgi:parvulin-like peptidyl-prolyl isomerase